MQAFLLLLVGQGDLGIAQAPSLFLLLYEAIMCLTQKQTEMGMKPVNIPLAFGCLEHDLLYGI